MGSESREETEGNALPALGLTFPTVSPAAFVTPDVAVPAVELTPFTAPVAVLLKPETAPLISPRVALPTVPETFLVVDCTVFPRPFPVLLMASEDVSVSSGHP